MERQDTKNTTHTSSPMTKPQRSDELFLNSAAIDGALGKLSRFFRGRISISDRETLTFCLRHIFYHVNQMYTLFLPELTKCSMGRASTGEEQIRIYNMPVRNMPADAVMIQYHIWSLLQEIEDTLERVELLCQLITSTTTAMLNALDRTCSIEHKRDTDAHAPMTDQVQSSHPPQESDEWRWGLALAKMKMNAWLQQNEALLPFSVQFAILEPMLPTLPQIDTALHLLLHSAHAIFGNILPDFQESETDHDEKATILLLDIIQRCDQILLQIGILAEPLHILTDQYTLETTI